MTGWRKRQIHDSQMHRLQDQESDLHESAATHAGEWPQEALHMLRVSPSTQAGKSLLRKEPVVDVLCGGTGRRDDRSSGPAGREGLAGDRSREEQAK